MSHLDGKQIISEDQQKSDELRDQQEEISLLSKKAQASRSKLGNQQTLFLKTGLILVLALLCMIIIMLSYLAYLGVEEKANFQKQSEKLAQDFSKIHMQVLQVSEHLEKEQSSRNQEMTHLREIISNQVSEVFRSYQNDHYFHYNPLPKDYKQQFVDQTYQFIVPKVLWLYKQTPKLYIDSLYEQNILAFAKKSDYEVKYIDLANLADYVPITVFQRIKKLIGFLKEKSKNSLELKLKEGLAEIEKKIILLNVLYQNGGVMTNREFAMREDLSWLKTIVKNPYVNRGNLGIRAEVVGFFNPKKSIPKQKFDIMVFKGIEEVDKYRVIFPTLQDFFIAAKRKALFLNELIEKVQSMLQRPQSVRGLHESYKFRNLSQKELYSDFVGLASQIILQNRQREIQSELGENYKHFAIDYYGLQLINAFYYPLKLQLAFESLNHENDYHRNYYQMTHLAQEEFLALLGPIRYIVRLSPKDQMNSFLWSSKNGKDIPIVEGSFIHQLFFPGAKDSFILPPIEKPFVNETNMQWDTLPKIIWAFWDSGIKNAPLVDQICVQNLKISARASGFEFREVNNSNLVEYLDKNILSSIETRLQFAKLELSKQLPSDLYRLAILQKHGGVYVDVSIVSLQNLNWILNIGRYPSQYIFNRFGNTPNIFMVFHPFMGQPEDWQYFVKEQGWNIKTQWHLGLENSFIAADKGCELIKEWLSLFLEFLTSPYQEKLSHSLAEYKIQQYRWTTASSQYLVAMEVLKCVLARREAEIERNSESKWINAADYYKLWGVNAYLGPQKLRTNINYDDPGSNDNPFLYRYSTSFVEGIVGKPNFFIKLFQSQLAETDKFVHQNWKNLLNQTHPLSFFRRFFWSSSLSIEEKNGIWRLSINDV